MAKKIKKRFKQDRRLWFRMMKGLIRLKYRKPQFVYLGKNPRMEVLSLSITSGAGALTMECYLDFPIRMWVHMK